MNYRPAREKKRPKLSNEEINSHCDFLKEGIFQLQTKWPQFKLLFDAVDRINKMNTGTVLVLERAYFYGGYTLFAPLFPDFHVIAVDCVIGDENNRFAQQLSWLNDERCIKWRPNYINKISDLKDIKNDSIDILFVPNVVHHERDQLGMFDEWLRVLKTGGQCIVFEGLVRELHHLPDDYVRYTPEGFAAMFERVGMRYDGYQQGTGVFDVISYVWQNALEYFPEDIRAEKTAWFFDEHYPYLQALDKKYPRNIEKPDKAFPMSYLVSATKAAPP